MSAADKLHPAPPPRRPTSLPGTYKLPAFFACGPSTGAINLSIWLQYPFKGGHLNLMIIHLFT